VSGFLAIACCHATVAVPFPDTVRIGGTDHIITQAVAGDAAVKADAVEPEPGLGTAAIGPTLERGKVMDGIAPGFPAW
jgi:hypothetical protein